MRISNELRVGIMFFVGLVLLVGLIYTMTRWGQSRKGYSFTIRFVEASGIQDGAEVRVAGVKVGYVSKVDLDHKTNQALVTVQVDKHVNLFSGYEYTVGLGGLVGERYIDIRPTEPGGRRVAAGEIVNGSTSSDMNDLIRNANEVVSKLSVTADSFNTIIGDKESQRNFKLAILNMKKAAESAGQFTSGLNQLLKRNQDSVDMIVADLQQVASNVRLVSDQLTPQLANSKFFANLDEASKNAVSMTARLDEIARKADVLIGDKALTANIQESAAHLKQASIDLEQIMSDAQKAASTLPQTAANLQQASADLPAITKPFKEIAPETAANLLQISRNLIKTSENIGSTAQQVTKIGSAVNALKIVPEARLLYMGNTEDNVRTDLNVDLRSQSNIFRIGVADIGNNNWVNAQYGNKFGSQWWLRYGIVQSQVGAGADYQPSENWRFSGDLFNLNSPQLNLVANYRINPLGSDWWLTGGGFNLFGHDSSWGAGVTYRHTPE